MKLVVISILYIKFKVGNTTAWLEVLCVNATEKKKNIPVEQLLPPFKVLNAFSRQEQLF